MGLKELRAKINNAVDECLRTGWPVEVVDAGTFVGVAKQRFLLMDMEKATSGSLLGIADGSRAFVCRDNRYFRGRGGRCRLRRTIAHELSEVRALPADETLESLIAGLPAISYPHRNLEPVATTLVLTGERKLSREIRLLKNGGDTEFLKGLNGGNGDVTETIIEITERRLKLA